MGPDPWVRAHHHSAQRTVPTYKSIHGACHKGSAAKPQHAEPGCRPNGGPSANVLRYRAATKHLRKTNCAWADQPPQPFNLLQARKWCEDAQFRGVDRILRNFCLQKLHAGLLHWLDHELIRQAQQLQDIVCRQGQLRHSRIWASDVFRVRARGFDCRLWPGRGRPACREVEQIWRLCYLYGDVSTKSCC